MRSNFLRDRTSTRRANVLECVLLLFISDLVFPSGRTSSTRRSTPSYLRTRHLFTTGRPWGQRLDHPGTTVQVRPYGRTRTPRNSSKTRPSIFRPRQEGDGFHLGPSSDRGNWTRKFPGTDESSGVYVGREGPVWTCCSSGTYRDS